MTPDQQPPSSPVAIPPSTYLPEGGVVTHHDLGYRRWLREIQTVEAEAPAPLERWLDLVSTGLRQGYNALRATAAGGGGS